MLLSSLRHGGARLCSASELDTTDEYSGGAEGRREALGNRKHPPLMGDTQAKRVKIHSFLNLPSSQ